VVLGLSKSITKRAGVSKSSLRYQKVCGWPLIASTLLCTATSYEHAVCVNVLCNVNSPNVKSLDFDGHSRDCGGGRTRSLSHSCIASGRHLTVW